MYPGAQPLVVGHRQRLQQGGTEVELEAAVRGIIGELTGNGVIGDYSAGAESDSETTAEDVVEALTHGKAVMSRHGDAAPVAVVGADPRAGTNSVATCVAVLGRVPLAQLGWVVGCTHLAEPDMATTAKAVTSVRNLCDAMRRSTQDTYADVLELYAVGGKVTGNNTFQELGRLLEGILQYTGANPRSVRLAGAWLPANDVDTALAVFIDPAGVYYTRDVIDDDSD
jgi:hypothetical protein